MFAFLLVKAKTAGKKFKIKKAPSMGAFLMQINKQKKTPLKGAFKISNYKN